MAITQHIDTEGHLLSGLIRPVRMIGCHGDSDAAEWLPDLLRRESGAEAGNCQARREETRVQISGHGRSAERWTGVRTPVIRPDDTRSQWGANFLRGLPYQTLIASLLHKYASGRLKEI